MEWKNFKKGAVAINFDYTRDRIKCCMVL